MNPVSQLKFKKKKVLTVHCTLELKRKISIKKKMCIVHFKIGRNLAFFVCL